jgi:hypothetical protein
MRTLCALLLCTNVALGASVETSPGTPCSFAARLPIACPLPSRTPWCIAGVVWFVWVFYYVLLTMLVSGVIADAAWCVHRHMAPQLAQKLPALPRLKSRAIGCSDAYLRIATPARYYMRLLFNFAGQRVPTRRRHPNLTIRLLTVRCLGRWSEMEIETPRGAQAV